MDNKRTSIAVLISPFASLFAVIIMFVESVFHNNALFSVTGVLVFFVVSTGFVILSFIYLIIFGIPIHYIFSKLKVNNVFVYVLFGISIALSIEYFSQPELMPYALKVTGYWITGVSAFFVSITFWYVAVKPI